jgi:hypothetical protein
MNQSKFSLADVLTFLAALGFGYMCFLGTNFYTLGNVPKSILVALIIAILLFSTAFTAKLLKRTSVNFKTCFIWEMLLLVVFTLLFVFFTYMPFSHYFTVSAKQTEIISKIQTSIAQAKNMFSAYESYAENRKNLYERTLKSVIDAKVLQPTNYSKYGFKNGVNDTTQLSKKMGDINADLFPTNYSNSVTQKGIKEVATNWLLDAENICKNWKPVGITNVVVAIEDKSNEWLSTLVEISRIREKGETHEDFQYNGATGSTGQTESPSQTGATSSTLAFDDIKQHFTKTEKPTVTSLLIAFLIWVLMLLSWFVAKRSTKSTIFTVKNKGEFDIEI